MQRMTIYNNSNDYKGNEKNNNILKTEMGRKKIWTDTSSNKLRILHKWWLGMVKKDNFILTKQMEKNLTAIQQECCEQYWTSPGGNTPQSSSYTDTNHPSRKLSKSDKPDMQDTAVEVGTSS